MSTYPGEPTPIDMPKDLERVSAVLDAPADPAPDALLQRILASRAAGERTILPVHPAPASQLRRALVRGMIAAGLLFAALAGWSLLSHRDKGPTALADADLFDFGLVTPGFAQTTDKPKYPAIRFDASRLHPVRLTYDHRSLKNGVVLSQRPFRIYTLEAIAGTRAGWRLITETLFSTRPGAPKPVWRAFIDSLRLDAATLEPVELVSRIEAGGDNVVNSLGRWRRNDYQIGDTVTTLHSMRHGPFSGDDLKRPETYDTVFPMTRDRFPRVVLHGQWITDLMAAPLATGWKGSVNQLMLGVLDSAMPIDFAVIGDEKFADAAGPQDCWKLSARFGGATNLTLLVRKSDGVLLSERWERKDGRDTIVNEMALTAEN